MLGIGKIFSRVPMLVYLWYSNTEHNGVKDKINICAYKNISSPVGNEAVEYANCIYWERVYTSSTQCPGYGPKLSETVTLELWGMQNTPSLPLLPPSTLTR